MGKKQALESQDQDQPLYTLLSSSDITLIPYVELEDGWTLPNEVLEHFAVLAQQSPVFTRTFYDGTVNTVEGLVESMQKRRNNPVFVFYKEQPAGVAWLNDVTANYAFGHFFVLREYWGSMSITFGKRVLKYWFELSSGLEFVIGMIPGFNRMAAQYVQRLGFRQIGSVPGLMIRQGKRDSCEFFYYSRFDHD